MDTSQLITIAVTAIITAFVKEIAGWLVSITKNLASKTTIKTKIKTALTVNKITAIVNFALMVFCSWMAFSHIRLPGAPDRYAVFNIAYFTCAAFANMLRLEIQLTIFMEITKRDWVERALIVREMDEKHAADLKPLDDAIGMLAMQMRETEPIIKEQRAKLKEYAEKRKEIPLQPPEDRSSD